LKPEHSRQYGKDELSRITTVTWVWFLKKSAFSSFSWQSEKISAKESCLYGIIDIRITPFLGVWILVFSQLYYTISSEELFVFG